MLAIIHASAKVENLARGPFSDNSIVFKQALTIRPKPRNRNGQFGCSKSFGKDLIKPVARYYWKKVLPAHAIGNKFGGLDSNSPKHACRMELKSSIPNNRKLTLRAAYLSTGDPRKQRSQFKDRRSLPEWRVRNAVQPVKGGTLLGINPIDLIGHIMHYLSNVDLIILYDTSKQVRELMGSFNLTPKTLIWTRRQRMLIKFKKRIWSDAMMAAVQKEQYDLFVWFWGRGIISNEKQYNFSDEDRKSAVIFSSKMGYKPFLEYYINEYVECIYEPLYPELIDTMCRNLNENGHLQLLHWVKQVSPQKICEHDDFIIENDMPDLSSLGNDSDNDYD
jgi:hypothetical protein